MKRLLNLPLKTTTMILTMGLLSIVSCQKEVEYTAKDQAESKPSIEQSNVQIESLAKGLASSLKDEALRLYLHRQAWLQFDGDHDVLINKVKDVQIGNYTLQERLAEGLANAPLKGGRISAAKAKVQLAESLDKLPLLNISVPVNIKKWSPNQKEVPLVAVIPIGYDEKTTKQIKAYDSDGNVHWLDSKKAPDFPVIAVGMSERVQRTSDKGFRVKPGLITLSNTTQTDPFCIDMTGYDEEYCNPYSCTYDYTTCDEVGAGTPIYTGPPIVSGGCGIPFGKALYHTGFKSENLGAIEPWIKGKAEIRMKILRATQQGTSDNIFDSDVTAKRSWIDNKWWSFNDRVFTWTQDYGDVLSVVLWEVDGFDGDNKKDQTIKIEGKYGEFSLSIDIPLSLFLDDDYVGTFLLQRPYYCSGVTEIGNSSLKTRFTYRDN